MAELLCPECYPLQLPFCSDEIVIPSAFMEGDVVYWKITDKFGNVWTGFSIVDEDENIVIDKSDFPDGLFTPWSGLFKFEILGLNEKPKSADCERFPIEICDEEYYCVSLSFATMSDVSGEPPYPPIPCICGYGFNPTPYKHTILMNDDLTIFFQAQQIDYSSTGNLVRVEYQYRKYVLGSMIEQRDGSVSSGGSLTENFGSGQYSLAILFKAIFDDGAEIFSSYMLEYDTISGSTIIIQTGVGKEEILLDCAEFKDTVTGVFITPSSEGRTSDPYWIDAEGNITVGNIFDGDVTTGGTEFDISWIVNIDKDQWRDFDSDSDEKAGFGYKFVACVDGEVPSAPTTSGGTNRV